jgi:hypothetical protein
MSRLTQKLDEADYVGRIVTEHQLADILGGSDARRYGLVNRALKARDLLRIKRGLYCTNPLGSNRNLPAQMIHPFAIAQGLLPGSYITFETALSHHGWIPEAVYEIASATPFRKSLQFQNDTFGSYTFTPIALKDYQFLVGVDRVKVGRMVALVAQPLRALMDLVATRKQAWQGINWLLHGLRIDGARLLELTDDHFEALSPVYKHKSTRAFLADLREAVTTLKAKQAWEPHTEIGDPDD